MNVVKKAKTLLVLFLGILFFQSCQNKEGKTREPEVLQQKVRIKPTYKAEDRQYKAYWGALELPVVNEPLPPNKAKQFVISRDSLVENFYKQMYFTKGGKRMKLDLIAVVIYNSTGGTSMYHFNDEDDFTVEEGWVGERIMEFVEYGAHFSLRGFVDNVPINSVAFRVEKANDAYHQPVYFKPFFGSEIDTFGFQLYRSVGRKTIVRLDTTAASTTSIYDMYKDKTDKYEILHIPKFKTVRRYYSDTEKLWPSNDFSRLTFLEKTKDLPLEMEQFPEFFDVKDKTIYLEWGTEKSPNIKIELNHRQRKVWRFIPPDSLSVEAHQELVNRISQTDPYLMVGDEKYTLARFDCWMTSEDGADVRLVTETIRHPEISNILKNIPKRSSVFFDNLLIKNKDGELVWFPMSFVFNFL